MSIASANEPLKQRIRYGKGKFDMRSMFTRMRLLAAISALGFGVAVRAGDPGGDLSKQQPKYRIKGEIPPAPIRSPEEELKTFKLPPGFRMELVAAEPLVEEPIALTFDPDGRVYVVEMRGYMPDVQGTGELDPVGKIVRLESSKGDGTLDKSTTFLEGLIIPRAVGLAGDGVLVAEPPTVWFCRDTKGEGKCTEKKVVFTDFGARNPNPEHMANGLMWNLDNWYYNADWPARFKFSKGQFLRDGTIARGQWGIAPDDTGRLFYNSNSSMLRCDLVPAQYMMRNPSLPAPPGLNVAIAANAVFSSRVNPGVNRGYTEDCNMEGHLARVTASCGPTIYRGGQYPAEFQGNAFVCEPAGNLMVRHVVTQQGVNITAKSVQQDGVDFLTSTDERFRPVSLYNAPDGSIYVVDLYHGILQHKAYVSAYLADQIKKRDLEKNDGHRGRIWRIVHGSAKPGVQPRLSKAPVSELVKTLSNPNGWWRDTAQRLLVERQDETAVPLLNAVVSGKASGATPLAKIHALYALDGLGLLDDDAVAGAMKDADARVRVAAVRLGEILIRKHTGASTLEAAQALGKDSDPGVQLQALSMGDVPELEKEVVAILLKHADDPLFRSAAISGAAGRELELVSSLIANKDLATAGKGSSEMFSDLAGCVVRGRSSERIEKLLELIAAQPAGAKAAQEALASGMAEAVAPTKAKTSARVLRLNREPAALAKLTGNSDGNISKMAKRAENNMSWPGKPGDNTPPLKPLTEVQEKRFVVGRELFSQNCATCHQPSGLGQDGIAPPLVDSEWVLGPEDRVTRILLCGLRGPLKVGKKTLDLEMPSMRAFDDEQVASILTYIRREWGHEANPVEPGIVTRLRKETAERGDTQWTAEELLQIK